MIWVRTYLVLAGLFLMALPMWAQPQQKTSFRDGISISPQFGLTYFFGDPGNHENQGYAYGLTLDKEFIEKFGIKFNIDKGNIEGVKMQDGERLYESYADYLQYGIAANFNISNLFLGYFRHRKLFFNMSLGGGLINYDETNRYLEGATDDFLEQVPFNENLHNIDEHGY